MNSVRSSFSDFSNISRHFSIGYWDGEKFESLVAIL